MLLTYLGNEVLTDYPIVVIYATICSKLQQLLLTICSRWYLSLYIVNCVGQHKAMRSLKLLMNSTAECPC